MVKRSLGLTFLIMLLCMSIGFAKTNVDFAKEVQGEGQPVALEDFWMGENPYVPSNTDLKITFQNNDTRTVDAIDTYMLIYDNFGEPTYPNNATKNYFHLLFQEPIKPNKHKYCRWTLFFASNVRKVKVLVRQVHFTNGDTWINKDFDKQLEDNLSSFNN